MHLPLHFLPIFWLLLLPSSSLAQQQWQVLKHYNYKDSSCAHPNNQQQQWIEGGKTLIKSSICRQNRTALGQYQLQWLTWEAGQWQEQQTVLIQNIAPKEQMQSLLSEDGQHWVLMRTLILGEKENKQLSIQLQRFIYSGGDWRLKSTQKDTIAFVEWLSHSPVCYSKLQLSKDGQVAMLYHVIRISAEKSILQTYHWENNQWKKKLQLEEVYQPQLSTNGQTIALLKIEDHETIRESWIVTYYQQDNNWQQVQQPLGNIHGSGYSYEYFDYRGYERSLKLSDNGQMLETTYLPGQGGVGLPQLTSYQLIRVGDRAYWFPKEKSPVPAPAPTFSASPSFSHQTLTVCQEYRTAKGQVIKASGIYQDTLVNYKGGDSILILDLTVIKIDAELSTLDNMLISLDTTAQVQWMDSQLNSQSIALEKNKQHYFIPPKTGNYRAELSKQGCVLSSKTVFYQKE